MQIFVGKDHRTCLMSAAQTPSRNTKGQRFRTSSRADSAGPAPAHLIAGKQLERLPHLPSNTTLYCSWPSASAAAPCRSSSTCWPAGPSHQVLPEVTDRLPLQTRSYVGARAVYGEFKLTQCCVRIFQRKIIDKSRKRNHSSNLRRVRFSVFQSLSI